MNILTSTLAAILLTATLISCQTTKVAQEPNNTDQTKIQIAMNHLNQGRPEAAVQVLRPMLITSRNNTNVLSLMGLAFMALDQPKTALEHLSKAHRLAPTPTTALNFSSALIEGGQNAKAYNLLLKIKKTGGFRSYRFPERVHHNLGLAAEKLNKTKLAEIHYRRAIAKNPSFYLTLMQLATMKQNLKQERAAQRYWGQARRVCLNCFDPVAKLANSHLKAGQISTATRLLQGYLRRTDLESNSKQQATALLQSIGNSSQRSAKKNKPQLRQR